MEFKVFKDETLIDTVLLDQSVVKIGRLMSSHIFLDDPRVARMHAALESCGETARLIDLGSTDGTKVNGKLVDKNAVISAGDKIEIGPYTIEVLEVVKPAQPEEPVSEETASEETASEEPAHTAKVQAELDIVAAMSRLVEALPPDILLVPKAKAWDSLTAYLDTSCSTDQGLRGVIWTLRRELDNP